MGIEQLDAEVVETVAGVVRLLRRAAELVRGTKVVRGHRASYSLWEPIRQRTRHSSLLPRRARLEGPTPLGQNPAELLTSARSMFLHQICLEDAPSQMLSLRARGRRADLGGEYRCGRVSPLQEGIDHESEIMLVDLVPTDERDSIPGWYTVSQVAQLLGHGETKVRTLIISGDLRSLKEGRSRRVLPEWVEDYVRLRASQAKDALD